MEITIELLATFFGWCAVINIVLLTVFTIVMHFCQQWASRIHTKIFDISESAAKSGYFGYLATYKAIILSLNIVPFVVLKILLAT